MNGFSEEEVSDVLARFQKLKVVYSANIKRVATLGGTFFEQAAQASAPIGSKMHYRYYTAKVNRKLRAPKGMGNIVATYSPGNLSRSLRVLNLKRAGNSVYVGAVLAKGSVKGSFSGTRADGYYLNMVEKGTKKWAGKPFFLSTWDAARPIVEQIMITAFEKIATQFNTENS